MNMYDTELDAGAEPIASVQKDKEFSLTANVNEKSGGFQADVEIRRSGKIKGCVCSAL